MVFSAMSGVRWGLSLLIAAAPLGLLLTGCGGGGSFTPLPTGTSVPTSTPTGTGAPTFTPIPTPTRFGNPTATPSPTPVGTTALDFSSLGSGNNYQGGLNCLGWRFTANRAATVTALGFYDGQQNGLTQSHEVGIFDVQSRILIGSTTVSPSDARTGFFRFHYLISPIVLTPGKDYYIMSLVGNEAYAVGVSNLSVNSAITFKGVAINTTNSSTTTLLYPDSAPGDASYHGNFGPTFRFE